MKICRIGERRQPSKQRGVGSSALPSATSMHFLSLTIIFVLLVRLQCISSFTAQPVSSTVRRVEVQGGFVASNRVRNTRPTSSTFFVAASRDPIVAQEDSEVVAVNDKNGKPIEVGTVVRVVKEMKAYQVPAKGRGSYNEEKEFVPIETDAARSSQNLVLPEGIRGVVSKVYRSEDIAANFPIKVQFTPGENIDEGYDPPVPFFMHFDPMEIECA